MFEVEGEFFFFEGINQRSLELGLKVCVRYKETANYKNAFPKTGTWNKIIYTKILRYQS